MTPRYDFTRLLVTHFKECFHFYRDVMGFKPGFGTENDTYADFEVGAVNISIFGKNEMSAVLGTTALPVRVPSQDSACFTFAVENVDVFCEHVREMGISLLTEPADHPDWGIRTAHFRDPDGNLIEINQPLKRE